MVSFRRFSRIARVSERGEIFLVTAMNKPTPRAVIRENIPVAMRVKRCVLWKYVLRGIKWTKVPKQPNGLNASVTDPRTWSSFDTVFEAYRSGDFDGIGFVLGDGWCGYDSDGVIDKSHLALLDTYAEISPSGKGAHAIGRYDGDPLPSKNVRPFEMYFDKRFFCCTGDHIEGTPKTVNYRRKEFEQLASEIFPQTKKRYNERQGFTAADQFSDDDLLLLIAKSADNFFPLWKGDLTDYESHSEADLALIGKLLFYTNYDDERADRLFRLSDLMRPKWDENRGGETYGERTIRISYE